MPARASVQLHKSGDIFQTSTQLAMNLFQQAVLSIKKCNKLYNAYNNTVQSCLGARLGQIKWSNYAIGLIMSYIYSAQMQARPSYVLPLPHYYATPLSHLLRNFTQKFPTQSSVVFTPLKTLTALTGYDHNNTNNNGFNLSKVTWGVNTPQAPFVPLPGPPNQNFWLCF